MGIEIIYVLIYPIALVCLIVAVVKWSQIAKLSGQRRSGMIVAYLPLLIGFSVSMTGLAILTYISRDAEFTSLIQQGYYIEDGRSLYLPRRVVGQAIASLVFLLPAICFIVIPLTVRLIKTGQLTLQRIGIYAFTGWVSCSLASWWILSPNYSLMSSLGSTAVSILTYAIPIPLAAFLFNNPIERSLRAE
jgi:hypothetical protein